MDSNILKKVKNRYKLPFVMSVTLLILSVFLKFALPFPMEELDLLLSISVVLTVSSGFLLSRGVKKAKEEEDLARRRNRSYEKRLQQQHEDKMQAAIDLLQQNIIIRSIYLFLCIIIALAGFNIIFFNKEYVFGAAIALLGILLTVHSIFELLKWIVYRKIYKQEKNKKVAEEAKSASLPEVEQEHVHF